jgi:hypothetical protein
MYAEGFRRAKFFMISAGSPAPYIWAVDTVAYGGPKAFPIEASCRSTDGRVTARGKNISEGLTYIVGAYYVG